MPARDELRNIGRSIVDHIKFKHPTGAAATRYNVLQSLAYLIVIFVLLPLIVFCGIALSPRLDTVLPGALLLPRRRQTAPPPHCLRASTRHARAGSGGATAGGGTTTRSRSKLPSGSACRMTCAATPCFDRTRSKRS